MSHNVVYLFSIYDEMSHNVLYLFSTPNMGNYRADMTISTLALNQSKLLKYLQQIINRDYFMVGECVRFLFTSCERSLNERVSAANE